MDEAAIFAQIRALAIEGDELVRSRNARGLCEPTAEESRRRRDIIDEIGVLQAQLRALRDIENKGTYDPMKTTESAKFFERLGQAINDSIPTTKPTND